MPISKINTSSITDNSVTAGKIVAGAVDADIAAGSIDTAQMADDAVTTDKLANAINTSIAAKAPTASPVFTGNVGIGVTPETWAGFAGVLSIGNRGSIGAGSDTEYSNNSYYNSGYKYIDTALAASYAQTQGKHIFKVAPSGTADSAISWNTAMTINNDGEVTNPLQPCFSATAATTNIPVATGTTVTLSSERFDVGANLTNNIFTAPITGKYLFTYIYYISNLDAGHTTFDAHILTSNKQYQQTFKPSVFMNSDGNFGISGSVIADMDANDTCRFNVYVAGGAAQTDIHADSHVSGCLLF
jgi:hypothetical protein